MKKIVSVALSIIFMFNTLSVCASTKEIFNNDLLGFIPDSFDDIVFISEDEAEYIAIMFVNDMINCEMADWDENTEVTGVKCLYDQSGEENVNAYSVELTNGYVIVTAFADAESLIPEWSDVAEPIYNAFDNDSEIIYLGNMEYYSESNNEITNIFGENICRNDLINHIDDSRNIDNIPSALIEQTLQLVTLGGRNHINDHTYPIIDPFVHAQAIYGGTFVCNDYYNIWNNYIEYFTQNYGVAHNYTGCCGPTAITNIIRAYENRWPNTRDIPDAVTVFEEVVDYGMENGYYEPGNATTYQTIPTYIYNSLLNEDIPCNVVGFYNNNYNDIKNALTGGAILFVVINNHISYGGEGSHAITCFAYTRLRSTSSNIYKTYLKVADGWYNSARYVDLDSADESHNGTFVKVEMWG